MRENGRIAYVELAGGDLPATEAFYGRVFGWSFTAYGPSYAAFDEGLEGGFQADPAEAAASPLVVLWADDLEAMHARVQSGGGEITREIFAFPGGRRFHFRDPAGSELAVVSAPEPAG